MRIRAFVSSEIFLVYRNCSTFLEQALFFLEQDLLEKYNAILTSVLSRVTNANMDETAFLQVILPSSKGRLGVSSAQILILPLFKQKGDFIFQLCPLGIKRFSSYQDRFTS